MLFRSATEEFSTIADAFAHIAEEIENWADDDQYGEQFEVEIPGGQDGHNVISIDARHVCFATIFPEDED